MSESETLYGVWLVSSPMLGPRWCVDPRLDLEHPTPFVGSLKEASDVELELRRWNPKAVYEIRSYDFQVGAIRSVVHWRNAVVDRLDECEALGLIGPSGGFPIFEGPRHVSAPLSAESLARALFDSDDRIASLIALRSESPEDDARIRAIAWERDEFGVRSESEALVERMVANLVAPCASAAGAAGDVKASNGDDGGVWAPRAPIVIGDEQGLSARERLK